MKRLTVTLGLFASRRYYQDPEELTQMLAKAREALDGIADGAVSILTQEDADAFEGCDLLIALPMSGAVQAPLLTVARKCRAVCIYPGYMAGNLPDPLSARMLQMNAAPAVMDTYAVLLRDHPCLQLPDSMEALARAVSVARAYLSVRSARLLLIGETEPWVVSASRELSLYRERCGVTVEQVGIELIESYYRETDLAEAQALALAWRTGAVAVDEPTEEDLVSASRFYLALRRLLSERNADGAAIACFRLLSTLGTTACLAVSRLNTEGEYTVACEGDLDSAVTMLLVRRLTDGGLWMANPNLLGDGRINFVHCTAPTSVLGAPCPYRLRSHHESGIGVSTEVELPDGLTLTACRFSAETGQLSVRRAIGRRGEAQTTCRTQYEVTLSDYGAYLADPLGCHQVLAFEDISREMAALGEMLGLRVLSF